jgi:hypothetical protein
LGIPKVANSPKVVSSSYAGTKLYDAKDNFVDISSNYGDITANSYQSYPNIAIAPYGKEVLAVGNQDSFLPVDDGANWDSTDISAFKFCSKHSPK